MPDKKTQGLEGLREEVFDIISNPKRGKIVIKARYATEHLGAIMQAIEDHNREKEIEATKHNEQAAQAAAEEINTNIFEIKNPEMEFKKMSDNSFRITVETTKATCNRSDAERDKQIILKHLQKKG